MTTIKHPKYKEFKEQGTITLFSPEDLKTVYENIDDLIGRDMFVLLYYTGCRPVQLLKDNFTTSNVSKEGSKLKVIIPPAKNGSPFTFYLSFKKFGITQLYKNFQKLPHNTNPFSKFAQKYVRKVINKKGDVKYYVEHSDKFRYYFKKWCLVLSDNPIPPYFLRHSRFSSMSQEGASGEDIMFAKGSKSYDSVRPYLHMSKDKSLKLDKKIK